MQKFPSVSVNFIVLASSVFLIVSGVKLVLFQEWSKHRAISAARPKPTNSAPGDRQVAGPPRDDTRQAVTDSYSRLVQAMRDQHGIPIGVWLAGMGMLLQALVLLGVAQTYQHKPAGSNSDDEILRPSLKGGNDHSRSSAADEKDLTKPIVPNKPE